MDDERARALLSQARRRAEALLSGLDGSSGDDEADHADPGDAAADLTEDEVAAGRAEDVREELAAIARAEQRLADGSYGRSVDSGEPIPDARLEIVPWAERTAAEQEQLERPTG